MIQILFLGKIVRCSTVVLFRSVIFHNPQLKGSKLVFGEVLWWWTSPIPILGKLKYLIRFLVTNVLHESGWDSATLFNDRQYIQRVFPPTSSKVGQYLLKYSWSKFFGTFYYYGQEPSLKQNMDSEFSFLQDVTKILSNVKRGILLELTSAKVFTMELWNLFWWVSNFLFISDFHLRRMAFPLGQVGYFQLWNSPINFLLYVIPWPKKFKCQTDDWKLLSWDLAYAKLGHNFL